MSLQPMTEIAVPNASHGAKSDSGSARNSSGHSFGDVIAEVNSGGADRDAHRPDGEQADDLPSTHSESVPQSKASKVAAEQQVETSETQSDQTLEVRADSPKNNNPRDIVEYMLSSELSPFGRNQERFEQDQNANQTANESPTDVAKAVGSLSLETLDQPTLSGALRPDAVDRALLSDELTSETLNSSRTNSVLNSAPNQMGTDAQTSGKSTTVLRGTPDALSKPKEAAPVQHRNSATSVDANSGLLHSEPDWLISGQAPSVHSSQAAITPHNTQPLPSELTGSQTNAVMKPLQTSSELALKYELRGLEEDQVWRSDTVRAEAQKTLPMGYAVNSTVALQTTTTMATSPIAVVAAANSGAQESITSTAEETATLLAGLSIEDALGVAASANTVASGLHSNTDTPRAEMARSIGAQLAEQMAKRPQGSVDITLNPEELGRVKMAVSPGDSSVTISILAERPETLDLMRRHVDQLIQEFKQLGYESVEFAFSDGATSSDEAPREQGLTNTWSGGEAANLNNDTDEEIPNRTGQQSGLDMRL